MAFVHPVTVRFGDCDPAGIAYFPAVFDWFHLAMEDWFDRGLGIAYAEVVGQRRIGFPAVHTEADFIRPCAFGDQLEVHLSVAKLGTSSVHLRYAIERGRASGLTVVSAVDIDRLTAVPLPDDVRAAMSEWIDGS